MPGSEYYFRTSIRLQTASPQHADLNRVLAIGVGIGYASYLANFSAGYRTFAEAFSGWRDSPPHRANMLNSGVTKMGIAAVYAPNTKYKVFWALILAAPDERRG